MEPTKPDELKILNDTDNHSTEEISETIKKPHLESSSEEHREPGISEKSSVSVTPLPVSPKSSSSSKSIDFCSKRDDKEENISISPSEIERGEVDHIDTPLCSPSKSHRDNILTVSSKLPNLNADDVTKCSLPMPLFSEKLSLLSPNISLENEVSKPGSEKIPVSDTPLEDLSNLSAEKDLPLDSKSNPDSTKMAVLDSQISNHLDLPSEKNLVLDSSNLNSNFAKTQIVDPVTTDLPVPSLQEHLIPISKSNSNLDELSNSNLNELSILDTIVKNDAKKFERPSTPHSDVSSIPSSLEDALLDLEDVIENLESNNVGDSKQYTKQSLLDSKPVTNSKTKLPMEENQLPIKDRLGDTDVAEQSKVKKINESSNSNEEIGLLTSTEETIDNHKNKNANEKNSLESLAEKCNDIEQESSKSIKESATFSLTEPSHDNSNKNKSSMEKGESSDLINKKSGVSDKDNACFQDHSNNGIDLLPLTKGNSDKGTILNEKTGLFSLTKVINDGNKDKSNEINDEVNFGENSSVSLTKKGASDVSRKDDNSSEKKLSIFVGKETSMGCDKAENKSLPFTEGNNKSPLGIKKGENLLDKSVKAKKGRIIAQSTVYEGDKSVVISDKIQKEIKKGKKREIEKIVNKKIGKVKKNESNKNTAKSPKNELRKIKKLKKSSEIELIDIDEQTTDEMSESDSDVSLEKGLVGKKEILKLREIRRECSEFSLQPGKKMKISQSFSPKKEIHSVEKVDLNIKVPGKSTISIGSTKHSSPLKSISHSHSHSHSHSLPLKASQRPPLSSYINKNVLSKRPLHPKNFHSRIGIHSSSLHFKRRNKQVVEHNLKANFQLQHRLKKRSLYEDGEQIESRSKVRKLNKDKVNNENSAPKTKLKDDSDDSDDPILNSLAKEKKKLKRVKRNDLETLILQLFIDKVLYEHELGHRRDLCRRLENTLDANKKKVAQFYKEMEDMKKVMQRLQAEHLIRKSQCVIPVKVKRSVGIQATPTFISKGLMHSSLANNLNKTVAPSMTKFSAPPEAAAPMVQIVDDVIGPSKNCQTKLPEVSTLAHLNPLNPPTIPARFLSTESKEIMSNNTQKTKLQVSHESSNLSSGANTGTPNVPQQAMVKLHIATPSPNIMSGGTVDRPKQLLQTSQTMNIDILPTQNIDILPTQPKAQKAIPTTNDRPKQIMQKSSFTTSDRSIPAIQKVPIVTLDSPTPSFQNSSVDKPVLTFQNASVDKLVQTYQNVSTGIDDISAHVFATDSMKIIDKSKQAFPNTTDPSSIYTSSTGTIPAPISNQAAAISSATNRPIPQRTYLIGNMASDTNPVRNVSPGTGSPSPQAIVNPSDNTHSLNIEKSSPAIPVTQQRTFQLPTSGHPAPLPFCPPPSNLGDKKPPPLPKLKLSHKNAGIVLSWNMNLKEDNEDISTYQLYAYQEGKAPPTSSLWKRVGCVKALQLPMACTLTQFMPGHVYHFTLRAIDTKNRYGPFAEPKSITL